MKKFTIGKTAWRRLGLFAAFCTLAFAVLVYTDRVLWDKNGTIMGFYKEPKNTVDVIYVGGSHTNAAISPTRIYEQTGTTGYVLYSWSQPIWTSYHYTLEALKTQTPKVVVLDAFGLVYGNTYMTDVDMNSVSDEYSLLIPPSLNRVELAVAMSRCQTEHKPFYSYFSLFQYHNRWKALTMDDLLWPLTDNRTTGKGFGPLYTTEPYAPQLQPETITPSDEAMYSWSRVYLEKFIALSKKEGFQLVLVNYPYIATQVEYDIYAAAKQRCAMDDIPFVDYLLEADAARAGFDYSADMAEHAHVNYKGAAKLTDDLSAFLHQNYDLPDHRADPAYAAWQADAEYETENLRQMDLRMTADLDSLLQKAKDGGYLVLLGTCGDLSAADSTAVQAALQQQGLADTAAVFAGGGEQAAAVIAPSAQNPGGISCREETAGAAELPLALSLTAGNGAELTVTAAKDSVSITLPDAKTGESTNVSRNRPGLNVVVADPKTGALIYSVSYSTLHDYTAFTE